MAGGADLFVPSLMAFALRPGFHAGFVGVPPGGLGVRMATNRAIQRGAGLQGAGFFGKKDRFITKLSSLLKPL